MFHTLTAMVSMTAAHVDITFPKTMACGDFYCCIGRPRTGTATSRPWGASSCWNTCPARRWKGRCPTGCRLVCLPDVFCADYCIAEERSAVDAGDLLEDLPLADNQVHLTPDGRINLDYTYNSEEGHEQLVGKLHELDGFTVDHPTTRSRSIALRVPGTLLTLYGTAHQAGHGAVQDNGPGEFGAGPLVQGPYELSTTSTWSTWLLPVPIAAAVADAGHMVANAMHGWGTICWSGWLGSARPPQPAGSQRASVLTAHEGRPLIPCGAL